MSFKKKDFEKFLSVAKTYLGEGKKVRDEVTITVVGETEGVFLQVVERKLHGDVYFVNGFFKGNHSIGKEEMTFSLSDFESIISIIKDKEFFISLSEDGERKKYLVMGNSGKYRLFADDEKYMPILCREDKEDVQKSVVFCIDSEDVKSIVDNTKDCLGCFTIGLDRVHVRPLQSGRVAVQATNGVKAWQKLLGPGNGDMYMDERFEEQLHCNVSFYLFKALKSLKDCSPAMFTIKEYMVNKEDVFNVSIVVQQEHGRIEFVELRQEFHTLYPDFESLKERLLGKHTGKVKIKQSYIEKIIKTGEVLNKGQKDKKMRKIRLSFLDGDSVMQVAYFKGQEEKIMDEELPVECTESMPEEIFFNTKVFDCFLNTGEEYVTLMVGEGTTPVMSKTNNEIRLASPMIS